MPMTDGFHPALVFFIGAAVVAMLRGVARSAVSVLVPIVSFCFLLGFEPGIHGQFSLLQYSLEPIRVDDLSLLFGYLFHLAAFIGVIYAWHVRDAMQQVSALAYAGAAMGAVFAGDLVTLFVFWELLALTSVFLVLAPRTDKALRTGMRYLIWNVLSGVMLLAGVLLFARESGTVVFDQMEAIGLGPWLILLAFGVKCGFPLFHTWIIDSYPASTATGTVFLSAFTTKTAVYALARGFPGTEELIYIGAVMTAFPIFYAVIENDLRKVLSYSMINQIGFMVVGIGIGTELALNGAVSHAFADVIFKGLLFMSMGAVLHMTGKTTGTDLGGLYKTMPKTTILCIIGALSISAFPLFSAFITKSMIMSAALHEGYDWLWFILLFASAGVLEHAGIKIPYFAFFAHDSGIRTKEPPKGMLIAMAISAFFCIYIGTRPEFLYSLLPWTVDYVPYTASHVVTQLQILFFAALAVVFLVRSNMYPPEVRGINVDLEWTYRKAGAAVWRGTWGGALAVYALATAIGKAIVDVAIAVAHELHGPRGIFARTLPIGTSAFFAALLLAIFLLLYFW